MKLAEKQKNCPYCHIPYKPFASVGKEGSYYVRISNVIGEGPIAEPLIGTVNILEIPNCPFCRRPLNEERINES